MSDTFSVVLVEPRYDGNVGSVARAMKNFGFSDLVIVNGPQIGPEGRKNAMHALDIVQSALRLKSFDEVVDRFDLLVGTSAKTGGDANHLRTPVFPEELVKAANLKGKVALVFGREDYGLLNEEIDKCDILVTIPANPEYPTLNIAQSSCILLYELSRVQNRLNAPGKKYTMMGKTEKEVLLRFFDQLIDLAYDLEFENRLAKKTFRSIVGRAFISGREAKTMTGVFRHIKDKK
ncbi:MAG: RNA methyltransferase [Candidatus Altiarchaeota archaeon]